MSAVTPASGIAADTPVPHYTAEEKRHRIFAIVGASSGNLVEWFDFYVYAFSRHPSSRNPTPPRNCSTPRAFSRPAS